MQEMAETELGGVFFGLFERLNEIRDKERMVRYLTLLRKGGVVTGPTMECFKKMDSLAIQAGVLLVQGNDGLVSPDFMSSPAWHPLWWVVLHEILRRVNELDKRTDRMLGGTEDRAEAMATTDLTGAGMLTDAVALYQGLFPDAAVKILGGVEDGPGASKIVVMGKPDEACTDAGTCAAEYEGAYAIRHVVQSLEHTVSEQESKEEEDGGGAEKKKKKKKSRRELAREKEL